jgi:hypothetical protein
MRAHLGLPSMVTTVNPSRCPESSSMFAEIGRATQRMLCLPFDAARERYAESVQAGLVKESMLGGAKFERDLASLEVFTLGPWARRA